MAEQSTFTIRISPDLQQHLDAMAASLDRSRSWVVNQALEAFVETQAWQIDEIKRALKEADAGDFAPEKEVARVARKYSKRRKP